MSGQHDERNGYATDRPPGGWGGPKDSPDEAGGWDSSSLENQVSRAAAAQQALNEAGFGPQDWEGFGKAVLLLCDTPFAEWNISEVPGLTQAGVQVRPAPDQAVSALPEHVSGVTPIRGHLDGRAPYAPAREADCVCEPPKHRLECPVHGPGSQDEAEAEAEAQIMLLRPPRRVTRIASHVTVHTADPRCWALATQLGWDLERVTIEADGSVIHHNSPEQAQAWRRKTL